MLIIKYFNEAYEEYLNGIKSDIFINKFIDNCINSINSKKIKYYSLSSNSFINSRKLLFNNTVVGFFTANFNGTLNNDEEVNYSLFLNYLSLILYNSKAYTINNNENLIKNILNSLENNILITDENFNIIYINDSAKLFLKNINNIDEITDEKYFNTSILLFLPYLKSFLNNLDNKPVKNKKIKLNISTNKIYIIINSFEYLNSYYNLFTLNIIKIDTIDLNNPNNPNNPNSMTDPNNPNSPTDPNNKLSNNSIAFLSHELRNPLQTINLASSLLSNNILQITDNKSCIKYVKMIKNSSEEMKKIINDILDLNKLRENEMNLEIINIDLKDFMENLINDIKENELKNNLYTINYNIYDDVPIYLFSDILRLKQILVNLITNSIKYSKKNQKNKIEINVKYEDNFIYFEVTDTGIGIKEEEINKIFECYGQTSDSYDRIDSNGLGLYICQRFANLLGGEILIKSIYDQGSTFTLKHPIKLGYTYNIKNIFNPIINLNKNFLIVDDRESNAILLKTILQNLSIKYNCNNNIEICLNGEQTIQLCKNNNIYDIIFMDINMEILDGYSTTKIIKDNGYKNIIIATTGDENVQIVKNNYVYFDDVLIKPFDESNLVNILSKFI